MQTQQATLQYSQLGCELLHFDSLSAATLLSGRIALGWSAGSLVTSLSLRPSELTSKASASVVGSTSTSANALPCPPSNGIATSVYSALSLSRLLVNLTASALSRAGL
jgi:hypothetical protein